MTGNRDPHPGPVPPHLPLRLLLRQGPWHIHAIDGPGADIVLAFASVGHDPTRPPSAEFVASASAGGRRALFVIDESRSWANAPGFETVLAKALDRLTGDRPAGRRLAIGQSMGAFAALVAASILPLDAVLAIGPQASIRPGAIPGETRWANWTARLPALRHADAPLPPGPRLTVMHGLADDRTQALAFPARPNLDHILFPGLTHSGLAAHLKSRGALAGLIDAALEADRRRLLRIAASAGGRLRQRLTDQLPR